MTDVAAEGRILVNRYRKARKIVDVLYRSEVKTEDFAEGLTSAAVRTLAGQVAGVNTPSEVTWYLVMELIIERRTP